MTTALPITADEQPSRPLPLWASIPIILLCLSAGGMIIRWYVGTRLAADEPHLLGDMPVRTPVANRGGGNGGGGGRNLMGWLGGGARGISPLTNQRDGYDAHTEHARATYTLGGKQPNLNLNYGAESAYTFVPDDVRKTVYGAARLTRDKKYSDALKLTGTQLEQLRQRSRPYMQASAADRKALLDDFAAYRSAKPADRAAAQTKLLADLDGVAERSKEPTKAVFIDAANKINAIISPDQWTQLKAMGL